MARYLFRLANPNRYSPNDISKISSQIRKTLGSNDAASHFRIGTYALEFNLFARNKSELEEKRRVLEENGFKILTEKLLDTTPVQIPESKALSEGIRLFNEERFWESHEVLEQVWRESTGERRDLLQSIILTAAAFVHYQKDENDIFFSVLKRARSKMTAKTKIEQLDLERLRTEVDMILQSGEARLLKIATSRN